MKKLLILGCALLAFMAAQAQKGFYVGGIAGIGQASFKNSSLPNQTNKLLVGGGVSAVYQFNRYVGAEVNGLIISKGTKATGTVPATLFTPADKYEERYDLLYAEIPLMARLRYGFGNFYIKAFGGPSFNFNIGGTYAIDFENSNSNDVSNSKINNLRVMETALVYGAGVEVDTEGVGLYSLSIRFSNGLSSIAKSTRNNNDVYNQYFAICLGWTTN